MTLYRKDLIEDLKDTREELRKLAEKVDHSNDLEELKRYNARASILNNKILNLQDDLLDSFTEAAENLDSGRDLRGGLKPVGAAQILGTYGIGQHNQTNRKGDKDMIYSNEKEELRASNEYKQAFFNYVMGRETTPEQRALVTTLTGAAVIPTTTFSEIVENVQKAAGLISRVRVLNIPGKLSVPQRDIQTPAAWHVEGAPIDDTTVPPTNISLSGFELAKLFSMSAATQSMSIAAFERYLIEELTRCTRDALSDAVFNGVGTTQPIGILNGFVWDATNSKSVVGFDTWTGLVEALALLAANFRQNAVFAMNSKMFYSYIASQLDANGNPIFVKDQASGLPLSLMGKEIIIDDFCPDDTIILGDPKYYFLNFSQPMSVERSTDAGFTSGTVVYRSMAVVDGKPVAPAFVKVTRIEE